MIKKCKTCSKEFNAIANIRQYCSISCINNRGKLVTKQCIICNKDFKTYYNTVCSKECLSIVRSRNAKKQHNNYNNEEKIIYRKNNC